MRSSIGEDTFGLATMSWRPLRLKENSMHQNDADQPRVTRTGSDPLTINYPPKIRLTVRRELVGCWPTSSYSSVKRLIAESISRTVVSAEILTYQSYVLDGKILG